MDRRRFVTLCAGSAAWLAAGLRTAQARDFTSFAPARLLDARGQPLRAASVPVQEALVFHYPFRSVPCFLINLGHAAQAVHELQAEDGRYVWPGGSGPGRSLVAYVAVCTHQLSYPDAQGSVIRYAAGKSEIAGRAGMIVCCAHHSVFDPAAGATRLHGEAQFPLAAVRLDHDAASDTLSASGIAGTGILERFMRVHKRRLIETYGAGLYREDIGATTQAVPLSRYSALVSQC